MSSLFSSRLVVLLAVMFAPLGSVMILYFFFLARGVNRRLYILIVAAVAGPTMLYGWGYFPRFVFANQTISLSVAPLILPMNRLTVATQRALIRNT